MEQKVVLCYDKWEQGMKVEGFKEYGRVKTCTLILDNVYWSVCCKNSAFAKPNKKNLNVVPLNPKVILSSRFKDDDSPRADSGRHKVKYIERSAAEDLFSNCNC